MAEFRMLTGEQKALVLRQLEQHRHQTFAQDFPLSPDSEDVLKEFIVEEGVLNPFIMASRYCAWYLSMNNGLYYGKSALDIGSGTGILGIVMAVKGAREVILSDISERAFFNSLRNIAQYCPGTAQAVVSDLFDNIHGAFDCIVFNHPFFADEPPDGDSI